MVHLFPSRWIGWLEGLVGWSSKTSVVSPPSTTCRPRLWANCVCGPGNIDPSPVFWVPEPLILVPVVVLYGGYLSTSPFSPLLASPVLGGGFVRPSLSVVSRVVLTCPPHIVLRCGPRWWFCLCRSPVGTRVRWCCSLAFLGKCFVFSGLEVGWFACLSTLLRLIKSFTSLPGLCARLLQISCSVLLKVSLLCVVSVLGLWSCVFILCLVF